LNNGGTFTATGSTITFNGTLLQTMSGTTTFNNLTLNNSSGLTIQNNETVNGTLTLTGGNITTTLTSTVIIPAGGSVSRPGGTPGWVIGRLQKNVATGATSRTFEVGEADDYDPVTVAFASVTNAGDLIVQVVNGEHPNINSSTINPNQDINDYWNLTNSGILFTSYNVTFTFASGDIDAGSNTNIFLVGKFDGGWTYPTVGTRTANSTQATGLTSFSDFVLGEPSTAFNDFYTTPQNTTLNVNAPGVLANDTGTGLTAVKVTNPPHGTINLNSNGSFAYVPDTGYSGPDHFTYMTWDGTGNSNIATVVLSVTGGTNPAAQHTFSTCPSLKTNC
jgi:hypothetical protein